MVLLAATTTSSLSPSYLVANIYRERALILASNDGILFNVLILLAGCWPRTEMKLLWLLATALRCARSSQQWRSSFCPTTCVANVPAFLQRIRTWVRIEYAVNFIQAVYNFPKVPSGIWIYRGNLLVSVL